ncbi:MAG: hypothetical protein MI867_11845 [Pseudomonadales bacterium]|nr:hypothetical protein [Pseudomonadales bacterium]
MSERSQKDAERLRHWLQKGGEARLRQSAAGELFDVYGPDRERQTGAGYKTLIPPLMDPRLKLTPQQRTVGATYGGYVEDVLCAGGSSWLQEFVDGGSSGSGGLNERRFMRMSMVSVARDALDQMPMCRYPLGSKRAKGRRGRHRPIPMLTLIDWVTIGSRSLSFIGVNYGWTMQRRERTIVPDRQRKHIAAALANGLDVIGQAWEDNDMQPPGGISDVDVE